MTVDLIPALAAYIPRDRVAVMVGEDDEALRPDGVALIADISGFTPLTEALTQDLRPDQGAEELTRALDAVFTPLIADIHRFHGSVIKFGGDALIVWFGRRYREWRVTVVRRALTAAARMQETMARRGQVPTPIGPVTLRMKIGLAYGPVRRFRLGLAEYGYEDVLVGATLDRMAAAEHEAEPGEILVEGETAVLAKNALAISRRRGDAAIVAAVTRPAHPRPWPSLAWTPDRREGLITDLAAYVPDPIYQTLLAGREQVAELKPVISLFVQFHGLDYDTDPAVGEKLERYFAAAQETAARYGGRVNRLITGDKGSLLHVIFGAPRSVEEQEARAVRCALALREAARRLPFVAMQRIGASRGRVFAGPVGGPVRHDYTVMGDAVNLSARLMQNAAPDQVVLTADIRDYLGPEFTVTDLGAIPVKGKAEPQPMFAAEAVGEGGRRRRQYRLPSLFGRKEETAGLRGKIDALAEGTGAVVQIVGEVGLGKTLLLDHARAYAQSRWDGTVVPGLWASGVSPGYGQTVSGYLFISLLRDLLQLPPGAGPDQTRRRLEALCRDLFGPERLEATYPYLARFMNLPLRGAFARRLEGLSGESVRWQLFELMPALLRRLCARRPVVLALDDVQWADPTSRQLIAAVAPVAETAPLLLLLASRPAPAEDRRVLPEGETLALAELDRETAVSLIAHHAPDLPPDLATQLAERGGGNPLFLVEMVRALGAQGALAEAETLTADALDHLDLPTSVQGLLLAQLDRLALEARHTLQLASVIGRTFLHKVLAVIAGAERALEQRLDYLEAEDFIRGADPTDLGQAHAFRHGLIHESTYNTLLYERRRAYHRQVAQTLERLFPAQVAEQAALLAYHYERAEVWDEAIYYLLQTADQARLLYAHEEAETLYRRVLDLLPELADTLPNRRRRARIYLKLAQVRANVMDFAAAQRYYEQAFALFEGLEPVAEREEAAVAAQPVFHWGILPQYTRNFDPALVESVEVSEIVSNLFEGLVELDDEWNVIPALARRWEVDEGGRRYRFQLRPEARWSNGEPLTAHDFIFAWRRNLDPETGAGMAYQLYLVEGARAFHQGKEADPETVGVRALDDLTLEIRLRAPANYFLYLLAFHVTFPQPASVVTAKGEVWGEPEELVSNGPFRVRSAAKDGRISLERNPFYRGFARGDLQRVDLIPVEPDLDAFAADRVDWCRVDDRADLSRRYSEETLIVQGLSSFFLGFACGASPFDDRRARQAFAHSVDRGELVEVVWSGVQKPAAGGMAPPGMPGHSPEIGLDFAPGRARRLLADAGFDGERPFPSLTLAALPGFGGAPAYLRDAWRKYLGVEVKIVDNLAADEALARLQGGEVQLILLGWYLTYPDPDDVLRGVFHSESPINYLGWENETFDALVEQAVDLDDAQRRFDLYHQADQILTAEETAVVPLYYLRAYGLLRNRFALAEAGKIVRDRNVKFKNLLVTG